MAVTATNSDSINAIGISAGVSGTVAVNVSGTVSVITVTTTAGIGASARINCASETDCSTNVAGANPAQSVLVLAGNSFHQLGIAAAAAGAGSVAAGAGVAVGVIDITTTSSIGNNTVVNASGDIVVEADASESFVSVAASAAIGGDAGLAGAVGVTVLDLTTSATTGTGVTLRAANNVLVLANDTTDLVLVAASLGAGVWAGFGAGVSVAVVTKTTEAHLGGNNVVTVLGNGTSAAGISDGTSTGSGSFGTKGAFHGLAVQANSTEELFGLTAGIAGGFIGIAGGIGVNIFTVVVKAFIAGGTTVNQGASGIIAGASSAQSVVVAATDYLKTLTVAGGVGIGAGGIGGGVDVGVANVTVQAYLGVGSDVWANGTVEIDALSTKHVQTYAVSLGGGVVGVAGSVTVWTVGTAATNTYQSAVSGPDRGVWSVGTAYEAGDIVSVGGVKYFARSRNTGKNPTSNPAVWVPRAWSSTVTYEAGDVVTSGGSSYGAKRRTVGDAPASSPDDWAPSDQSPTGTSTGNADSVASGGDTNGGSDNGWGSVLGGAGSIDAWVSGTDYVQGQLVSSGGHYYVALTDLTASAVAPEIDAATATPSWALSDDNYQLRQQTSTVGAQTSVTGASPGGSVASSPFTQPAPPSGTSATVYGSIHAGGDVQVRATDRIDLTSLAGVAAVGLGALGAGVAIINLGLVTDAGIASTGSVSSGATVGVHAVLDEHVDGLAAAGALGGVTISGQVVVITDSSSQNAHIDSGATVPKAVTALVVDTIATRTISAQTYGVSIALGAIGAAITVALISGDTTASIGNVLIGSDGGVGSVSVTSSDTLTPTVRAYSIQAGVGAALSGAVAVATYSGTTRAEAGAHGTVVVGGLTVTATGHHENLKADTVNVTTGVAAAIGATVAWSNVARDTEAATLATGSINSSAPVLVRALAWNQAIASAPGGAAGGGVAIALMFPFARVSGHTTVQVDGDITGSTGVTMEAAAENTASSTAIVVGVSLGLGASGAYAQAYVTSTATIIARVGASATISSTGGVSLSAHGQAGNNTAVASAFGGSGGSLAAGTVMVSDALVDGAVEATFGGSIPSAASLSVTANETDTATASTIAVGLSGLASAAAAASLAAVGSNADVTAATTGGPVAVTGAVTISANGPNVASASSDAGSASFGLSIGVTIPTASIAGAVLASAGGSVTSASSISVTATGSNTATATALAITAGLFTGNGSSAAALILAGADVTAETTGSLTSTGATSVTATGHNVATAAANGGSGGGISIAVMLPTASIGGAVHADVNGSVNAGSLTVTAIGQNKATSTTTVASIGLAGGAGAQATATITSAADTKAEIGAAGSVSVTGAVLVHGYLQGDQNLATATASGGAGGVVTASGFVSFAEIGASVTGEVNGAVTSAASLDVNAEGTNHAKADTLSVAIGAGAGAGAASYAHITSDSVVGALAASTSSISISGATSLAAVGVNVAEATSQSGSGGLLAVGVAIPTARIEGDVTASFDGSVSGGSGLGVSADGTNTATVSSTPVAVGFFSGAGGSVVAEITSLSQVTASVGSDAVLTLGSATATVHATVDNTATATSNGGSGGAISVSVLLASAKDDGGSSASFDGELVSAGSLRVLTDASHAASATILVVSIGIVGVGVSDANAAIGSTTSGAKDQAYLGGHTRIHSGGTAITVSVTRGALAGAGANGGAGGFVGVAGLTATSSTKGQALAYVADGAVVGTATGRPGSLSVTATDASVAGANSTVGTGGFVAAGITNTNATAAPTVSAYLDSNVTIVLGTSRSNSLTVKALSQRAEADATSRNYGGGAAQIGTSVSHATSQPTVRAFIGTGSTVRAGGNVSVTAASDIVPVTGAALDDFLKGLTPHGTGSDPLSDSLTFPSHGLSSWATRSSTTATATRSSPACATTTSTG